MNKSGPLKWETNEVSLQLPPAAYRNFLANAQEGPLKLLEMKRHS